MTLILLIAVVSHDNASNMSGKYNGMQAIIRQHCSLAEYVPCVAHSLNLVGQSSANCCQKATGFFNFLQRLYSFFAASAHRWKVLAEKLSSKSLPTVKCMSDTRWSARADATEALVKGYDEINAALEEIHSEEDEKPEAKHEAGILASDMQRFHRTSQALQSADQDLNTAVALFESLIEFVQSLRTRFEEFEAEGKKLSECDQYAEEVKRVRTRNHRYEEPGSAPELLQTPSEKFHTGTFLVVIDSLDAELRKRLNAYANIAARFGFLRKLADLSNEVIESAKSLQEAFPRDLEASLSDELLQCSSFLNTEFAKKALNTTPSHSSTPAISLDQTNNDSDTEDDKKFNVESPELHIYRLLVSNNLEAVFPNTVIVFRIYLSMMVSNCSGERSFSKLKLLKTHLRSCMTQERLNSLAMLNIETNVLRGINMSSLINDFALKKPVSITFIENLRSETILASYNLHSLLAMLNILPSTCKYYGAVYFKLHSICSSNVI